MKCYCDRCRGRLRKVWLPDGTPLCESTIQIYNQLYGPLSNRCRPLQYRPPRKKT